MHSDEEFSQVAEIGDLSKKWVERKKEHRLFLAYLLVKLALLLPCAIAIVERTFSTINIMKNRLHNRIGDD